MSLYFAISPSYPLINYLIFDRCDVKLEGKVIGEAFLLVEDHFLVKNVK